MNPIFNYLLGLTLFVKATMAFALMPLGCLIEPSQVAQVGSQVVGVTESVNVERGDVVQKGQILATLKSDYEKANVDIAKTRSQLEADVRSAEANLELARITEKRGVDLVEKKFLSQQALDKSHAETVLAEQRLAFAKEQLRISGGELNVARVQLSLRSIRAPFDGIVAERFVWPGERVEDKPLFKIVKIQPLRVEIVAPVAMYGQVEKSQIIQIKPDLANTASVDAKVVLVDKVIDGASNTFRIRAEIENLNAEIPSGLRCTAVMTPDSVAKANSTTSKVSDKVSDGPVTLSPQNTSKHSFELKPMAKVIKPEAQGLGTHQNLTANQQSEMSQGLKANPPASGLTKGQNIQAPSTSNASNVTHQQTLLSTAKRTPLSSSASSIKMPSDKMHEAPTAVSIEEQYKQLQQQREALKSGTFKPATNKALPLPDAGQYLKINTQSAMQDTQALVAEDGVNYKGAIAYPLALSPKSMRQVTPMPVGLRRITYRDALRTFPIRRVVALERYNEPATSQSQDHQLAVQVSTVNRRSEAKFDSPSTQNTTLMPKLIMEKVLPIEAMDVTSTAFQSN